MFVLEETGVP